MPAEHVTRCALLTPPGRGALASVVVEGPAAVDQVARWFAPAAASSLAATPLRGIRFGRWQQGAGEELVVCRSAPRRVEIHCHGGALPVQAILTSLVSSGCTQVDPWTLNAESFSSALEADAARALTHAITRRAAGVLLDQVNGALRQELAQIEQLLGSQQPAAALALIDRLLAQERLGLHLTEPFRVVLAGPPNAGKSSLLNALVGHQRAIVHPLPGTTRDLVSAATAIYGWPVSLIDTAGLHAAADELEQAGMQLAVDEAARADVQLLVFDRAAAWTAAQSRLAADWPDALIVHNKADLAAHGDARPPGLSVSALAGLGIDALIRELASRLVADPPESQTAVPFRAAQFAALREASSRLEASDLPAARLAVHALLAAAST